LSLLWLFHPSAALILLSNDPDHTLAYIFAVFHYMRDKATGNFRLSFLWALHPALAMAAVTRELGRLRHHVFPFYHYSDDTSTPPICAHSTQRRTQAHALLCVQMRALYRSRSCI
jgi:hypothetical protein